MFAALLCLIWFMPLHDLSVTVREAETQRTLRGATVRFGDKGAVTGRNGTAILRGCGDTVVVRTSMLGYVSRADTHVVRNTDDTLVVLLAPRLIDLKQITVTGARSAQTRDESPMLVTVTDRAAMSAAQAVSLADGLSFQPGLRLENNCQNCGFTQVRLNGLQGPYTQILIDSRPVFSSLAGVYGLEHIPVEMIDRIEVIRGAGSALYGAGAIAGTINVIPRDPSTTSFTASTTGSWMNALIPDVMSSVRGSWSSADLQAGVTAFGVVRQRSAYDHNGDTYSELPLLRTASGGVRAVYEFSDRDRLTADAHWIREFRRGGNLFALPPYQADIAEQLDHAIAGGALQYEHAFDDGASRIGGYTSLRSTQRSSYYGGTGGDPTAIEQAKAFFGVTRDVVGVGGVQATTRAWTLYDLPLVVTAGVEAQGNSVHDVMPGYARSIRQRTADVGSYAQVQIAPASPLSLALGMRADVLRIEGTYDFDAEVRESINTTFFVVNPRVSVIGRLSDVWQVRTTYASGFRGPQTFDEDLHISTLQGAARLIRLDPNLRPERSHSFTLSVDGSSATPTQAISVTADFFATLLRFPFVTALIADTVPGTIGSRALKTNGDAAWVAGANFEFRLALTRTLELTTAVTLQQARYATPQLVAEGMDGRMVRTPDILRTPDVYASAIATWTPVAAVTIDASCIVTGPMWVVNERTIERNRTPSFADVGLRAAYDVHLDDVDLRVGLGVVNLFDAFQRDLERGPQRDAAYVYGPIRPRTVSITVTGSWD